MAVEWLARPAGNEATAARRLRAAMRRGATEASRAAAEKTASHIQGATVGSRDGRSGATVGGTRRAARGNLSTGAMVERRRRNEGFAADPLFSEQGPADGHSAVPRKWRPRCSSEWQRVPDLGYRRGSCALAFVGETGLCFFNARFEGSTPASGRPHYRDAVTCVREQRSQRLQVVRVAIDGVGATRVRG